jgi:hypothetical protein
VHRQRPRQVGGDLAGDASLRRGERERQVAQQRVVAAAADRGEGRRALRLALALGLQLGELLRQQLVELEALPGRMRAVLERLRVEPGRGSWRRRSASRSVGSDRGMSEGGTISSRSARARPAATALRSTACDSCTVLG